MQKNIGINVRNLRKLHKMSLNDLAQKIAMSPGNLSRIERGELNITIKILEKISRIFNCQPQDIFVNPELESSNNFIEKFRQASKYINLFNNKIFVIALGGEVFEDEQFESIAYDINLLRSIGIKIIIIHGIRPQIDDLLISNKIKTSLNKNIRITDANSINHVIDINGRIRTKIESILSSSIINSPLFESDIKLSSGNFITARPLGILNGIDMKFTGQVRKVNSESIQAKLNNGEIVIISPLGYSPIGDIFNLSYEQLASAVASSMKAHKLIFYINSNGIINLRGELLTELTTEKATNLIHQIERDSNPNKALNISYQDFNIIKSSLDAIKNKVEKIHLINRHTNGSIIEELFTDKGSGTILTEYPLEKIREAKPNDVNKIFQLIEPLSQNGILVKRASNEIKKDLSSFYVMEHSMDLVGCVALFKYEEKVEIACFAIDSNFHNQGFGSKLIKFCEKKAKTHDVNEIFILTTQSEHWFIEKGFKVDDKELMPKKRKIIYQLERNSKFLTKKI